MLFEFATVAAFLLMGAIFVLGALFFGILIRPNNPEEEKSSIYECAERPIGGAWFRFNPRFYILALVFIVFDVEIALMYPVATVFRSWAANGMGWVALVEIATFLGILFAGLAYIWARGDLNWIKQIQREKVMDEKTLKKVISDASATH